MNQSNFPSSFTDAICDFLKDSKTKQLHEPLFVGNETKYLKQCIDTGYVSSVGAFVNDFESAFANYVGAKHAVSVVNGTAALFLSMKVLGVEPMDEVMLPSFNFIAAANAIHMIGAIPHFVEINRKNLGIDVDLLDDYLNKIVFYKKSVPYNKITGNRVRLVIPMHVFGNACDIEPLVILAKKYNLYVLEDAAESLGSKYGSTHTGNFGDIGIFSFNGNKIITTGGGGMITTNSEILALKLKHLSTTAKVPHKWEFIHTEPAYNFRMPNLNAALGIAQLELLNQFLEAKKKLFTRYQKVLAKFSDINLLAPENNAASNNWLITVVLDSSLMKFKDDILALLNNNGIGARSAWRPNHLLSHFSNYPRMKLSITEEMYGRIINLPSGAGVLCDE